MNTSGGARTLLELSFQFSLLVCSFYYYLSFSFVF